MATTSALWRLSDGWDYLRIVFTIHWFGFLYYTLIVFLVPEKEFARLTGSSDPTPSGLELMYFVGGLRIFIQVVLACAVIFNTRLLRWTTVAGMLIFEAVFMSRFVVQSGFGGINRYWPPLLFMVLYSAWIVVTVLKRRR